MKRLAITDVSRRGNQLWMTFDIDGLRFSTSYWYGDVDLEVIDAHYGTEAMRKLYFHIAAFEANKLCSLQPEVLDLGPLADLHTPAFERVWRRVFDKVWAQWRYEHDLPDYRGPAFISEARASPPTPIIAEAGDVEVLLFCGGGKDSLVAAKLLERAGMPYASFVYSHSIYGRAAPQHTLIDRLLDQCAPVRRHRQWVYDNFMDSPVLELTGAAKTLTAAETPASVFGALPLVLARGYRYLVLAHEASANRGNLIWNATGKDVNHQWGKSLDAEQLLNDYLQTELVSNVAYFSVLQPIHDVVIFYLLNRDLEAVPMTHSCNLVKPWCWRCPKCAYVWLGYMAYLPREVVEPLLVEQPFELPENQMHFRRMLGLEDHTPFECIGQIDETRLAFEMCRRKGYTGSAIDMFESEVEIGDLDGILRKYLAVDGDLPGIPEPIRTAIVAQMNKAAAAASEYIRDLGGILN